MVNERASYEDIVAEMDAHNETTMAEFEIFCKRIMAVEIPAGHHRAVQSSLSKLAERSGFTHDENDALFSTWNYLLKGMVIAATITELLETDDS